MIYYIMPSIWNLVIFQVPEVDVHDSSVGYHLYKVYMLILDFGTKKKKMKYMIENCRTNTKL